VTGELFREGGPHRVKRIAKDRYRMAVSLPTDEDGRLARECPNADCSPGYFNVKCGTGIIAEQTAAYCPYCKRSADPNDFSTEEQLRYAKDLILREAHRGLGGMVQDALGIGPSGKRKFNGGLVSIEMSYKAGPLPYVRQPYEDEVRRDVVCPHCALDQTVFGLATWCADCGRDIFLSHIAAELEVTRRMLGDISRRRELLGKRVAAKDLENCLEDAVSIFEAAMKVIVRRVLLGRGEMPEKVDANLRQLSNTFQNIARTHAQLKRLFDYDVVEDNNWATLTVAFEKRHPITHNLGVVDRKYLERTQVAERQGREVRITPTEVEALLSAVREAIERVYQDLVTDTAETNV
jgi:hypothetical protein